MAKIVFYFDCASVFSYIGFEFMEKYRELWNIEVDYRPFFLQTVMDEAQNTFSPNKLPFLFADVKRTANITGIPFKGMPPKYPYDPTIALCTLQYLKAKGGMEEAMRRLWQMEYVGRRAPADADAVKEALRDMADAVDQAIISPELLEAVQENTKRVVELRGFGAPTILVYRDNDKPQMFFGSDRFEHIAVYLSKEFLPMKQLFANSKL
ncbi:hypothetical protein GGI25_005120 [Coemansia spiralis]|uniref:Glutathione S-transferase kappa n=2 Tax=Coemansia TaxID=4863 RepID=A0A9W8KWI5_9FUNG|nr:DSBA-like thioredoxin domain-containing protein [Coemansia spiralis]KAJ1988018.1 hypothetical protein EDC05_005532 [Coemansia umbellata]KAJ2619984.1 hypothetical protein GGI26_005382 [Coemansia sp. RSA 1358]KAJ2672411.1 hypothetical protein GGI25_005120 [Coemansia spiralis]